MHDLIKFLKHKPKNKVYNKFETHIVVSDSAVSTATGWAYEFGPKYKVSNLMAEDKIVDEN